LARIAGRYRGGSRRYRLPSCVAGTSVRFGTSCREIPFAAAWRGWRPSGALPRQRSKLLITNPTGEPNISQIVADACDAADDAFAPFPDAAAGFDRLNPFRCFAKPARPSASAWSKLPDSPAAVKAAARAALTAGASRRPVSSCRLVRGFAGGLEAALAAVGLARPVCEGGRSGR